MQTSHQVVGGSGTVLDVPSSSDNNIKSVMLNGRYAFKYSYYSNDYHKDKARLTPLEVNAPL